NGVRCCNRLVGVLNPRLLNADLPRPARLRRGLAHLVRRRWHGTGLLPDALLRLRADPTRPCRHAPPQLRPGARLSLDGTSARASRAVQPPDFPSRTEYRRVHRAHARPAPVLRSVARCGIRARHRLSAVDAAQRWAEFRRCIPFTSSLLAVHHARQLLRLISL